MEERRSDYATEDSEFIRHDPCPNCGSNDNLGVYTDHSFCFGCKFYEKGERKNSAKPKPRKGTLIGDGRFVSVRGLSEETVRKFGYSFSKYNGKGCYIANYCKPDGTVVRQKLRFKDKKFIFLGKSKVIPLFGQHLWSGKGKKIVVTEGEIDAMSVSQMQDNKWPVVSIGNGASGAEKHLKMNLEWLEGYDEVVLMFDNDKPGREAAAECAKLFSPGKVSIASLPMKDANELLQANRGHEIVKAMWDAKKFRPDGLVEGCDTWEILTKEDNTRPIKTPWNCLNEMLHGGPRTAEITMVCAGTGIGKSQFCRQFAWNALKNGERVAYIALEETASSAASRSR